MTIARAIFFSAWIAGLLSGCRMGLERDGEYLLYVAAPIQKPDEKTAFSPPPAPGLMPREILIQPEPVFKERRCSTRGKERCVALKYLVYQDAEGQPVEDPKESAQVLDEVNRIWKECGIAFQMDHYQVIDPRKTGLRFHTSDYRELTQIRKQFGEPSSFLIVKTGPWNRSGSIGNTAANAWTNLPGEGLYGSILEKTVALDPRMVAHELGHYMSLDHVRDRDDLMNPIVVENSIRLDRDQCAAARWSLKKFWKAALRTNLRLTPTP